MRTSRDNRQKIVLTTVLFSLFAALSGVAIGSSASTVDTDGGGMIDALDADSDDGTDDVTEGVGDSDGDGTPDYRDLKGDDSPDGDLDAAELPVIDETNEGQPCARGVTK